MQHLPELLARFLIGGVFVSFFSAVAEVFRPKSFAGLFGAAPSIALATLAITIGEKGKAYAAIEAHFMIFGAIAFCCYAMTACWILRARQDRPRPTTLSRLRSIAPRSRKRSATG